MPADDDAGLAAEVAVGDNALATAGRSDLVSGHASLRDPAGHGAWMKASGWGFEEVTPERVVLVARDGTVVAGTGRRHIDFPIHLEVMAARPDVGSVVHTHRAAATAFASLAVPLRALSHDGVEFALPPVPRCTRTGSLCTAVARHGRGPPRAVVRRRGAAAQAGRGLATGTDPRRVPLPRTESRGVRGAPAPDVLPSRPRADPARCVERPRCTEVTR
ncbi:class II aldolase/adducin family protein [Streptomyces sp. NPDC090088]|uniref:class II aldolase/adducin family protein n=1 Tax=Streptomyces sp. NPDC090088 TaxID=3365944 RepID=UPI00382AF00B